MEMHLEFFWEVPRDPIVLEEKWGPVRQRKCLSLEQLHERCVSPWLN